MNVKTNILNFCKIDFPINDELLVIGLSSIT